MGKVYTRFQTKTDTYITITIYTYIREYPPPLPRAVDSRVT